MYEFVLGLFGAMIGIGAFLFGYWFNSFRRGQREPESAGTPELTEEEIRQRKEMQQQLIDDQKAFSALMSYNVNDAYGMNKSPLERDKS